MPGGGEAGDHPADPFDDMLGAKGGGQLNAGLDAVLRRDHHRGGPEEWSERWGHRRDLRGLHRDQHQVDPPDGRRIVGGLHGREVHIAVHTLEKEPRAAQRGQRGRARDECHVVAGGGESGAEDASHRAGANHGDAHMLSDQFLVTAKPEMCASVLWPIRKPTTPSVLLSLPAPTTSLFA